MVEHSSSEIYLDSAEYVTTDMPKPKGKPVTIIAYFYSNRSHYLETCRSLFGIIIFLNKIPGQSYFKEKLMV